MMQRTRPPFRADHVGSLLRPQRLKEARARFAAGEIPAAELRRIESLEISTAVQRQKQNGLRLATDGEFRRAWWHFDFLKFLDGCEIQKGEGAVVAGRVARHQRRKHPRHRKTGFSCRSSDAGAFQAAQGSLRSGRRDAQDDDTLAVDAALSRRP